MSSLNTSNHKEYSWSDTVMFYHSNGQSFPISLSSVRNTDYVGYVCSSCKSHTTLAAGKCGSCGNPFEPLDLREAKELFPSVQVKEDNPDRVAFLLLHRAWICTTCNSYNVNYPRSGITEDV
jgi:DNA-directed RNA polymerase subunit RPC12/RpoP